MKRDPLTARELSFRAQLTPKKNSRGRYDELSPEYTLWARRARARWEALNVCWWHPSEGRWLMFPPYLDDNGNPPLELRGFVRDHPEAEKNIPGVSAIPPTARRGQPAIRRGLRGR